MTGYEPDREERLSLPCDACTAPCGWRAACPLSPDSCGHSVREPCDLVIEHEVGHLADRAFVCVMGFPPPPSFFHFPLGTGSLRENEKRKKEGRMV